MIDIIALSGRIGSGKDTVGSFINELLPEYNWKIKRFADIPKLHTSKILGVPIETFNSHDNPDKEKYRKYYRDYAEKCKEVFGDDVWANALKNEYKKNEKWLVLDLRFPYELNALKLLNVNLRTIRMLRMKEENNQHISETALNFYKDWDYIIDNKNMSIEELRKETVKMLNVFGFSVNI